MKNLLKLRLKFKLLKMKQEKLKRHLKKPRKQERELLKQRLP